MPAVLLIPNTNSGINLSSIIPSSVSAALGGGCGGRLNACVSHLLAMKQHWSGDDDESAPRLISDDKSLAIDCFLLGISLTIDNAARLDKFERRNISELIAICKRYCLEFIRYFSDVKRYLPHNQHFERSSLQCHSVIGLINKHISRLLLLKPTTATPQQPLPVDQLLKVYRIMSRSRSNARYLVRQINIKPILKQLMSDWQHDSQVQIECCAIVANLASFNRLRKESIGGVEFIPLILQNMKRFRDRPEVETEICAALSNLSLSSEPAKGIIAEGGMELLLDLCDHITSAAPTAVLSGNYTTAGSVDLLVQALHVVANLANHGVNRYRDLTRILDTVYSSGIRFDYSVELMTAVNNLVGSLAFAGYKINFEQGDRITEMILCGMRRFQDNSTLLVTACFAMAHMSFGKVLCKERFKSCHGMENIFNSMDRFPTNHSLQTTACFALGSIISGDDELRKLLWEKGGIRRIFNAIRQDYPENQQSQLSTRRRLKQIISTRFDGDPSDNANDNDIEAEDDEDEDDSEKDFISDEDNESTDNDQYNGPIGSGGDGNDGEDDEDEEQNGGDGGANMMTALAGGGLKNAGNQKSKAKQLLLQLFGCVALFNLTENDECEKELRRLGVWRYLYESAVRVANLPELYFVLYTIFIQLTSFLDHSVYIQPSTECPVKIPSLTELCLATVALEQRKRKSTACKIDTPTTNRTGINAVDNLLAVAMAGLNSVQLSRRIPFLKTRSSTPNSTSSTPDGDGDGDGDNQMHNSTSSISQSVSAYCSTKCTSSPEMAKKSLIDSMQLVLPGHLISRLEQLEWCHVCRERLCMDLERCIVFYELSTKHQICRKICSSECALRADERLRKGERRIEKVSWIN